jgi:hypothetical protein
MTRNEPGTRKSTAARTVTMKQFLKRQVKRVRILLEDRSSHALYDNRGYMRP